jgi:hypothetical protein
VTRSMLQPIPWGGPAVVWLGNGVASARSVAAEAVVGRRELATGDPSEGVVPAAGCIGNDFPRAADPFAAGERRPFGLVDVAACAGACRVAG